MAVVFMHRPVQRKYAAKAARTEAESKSSDFRIFRKEGLYGTDF